MSLEPSDDSELVHRGSIRELLLEVPLVVAGYLGKAVTTVVFNSVGGRALVAGIFF